jgi:carbonic anhydrase
MQKLVQGIHHFQKTYFSSERKLFERLAEGQNPEALFITCSDSRISTDLLMQSNPGDLFVLRNAGNIIPAYGAPNSGAAATIEFAVGGLGVKDIVVCGHSHCGAMKGLLNPETLRDLPAVAQWLSHAEATRRILKHNYQGLDDVHMLKAAVEENVLVQIENLRTHPSVAAKLAVGALHLHAWVYKIETGEVFTYDAEEGQYVQLSEEVGAVTVPTLRALKPRSISQRSI